MVCEMAYLITIERSNSDEMRDMRARFLSLSLTLSTLVTKFSKRALRLNEIAAECALIIMLPYLQIYRYNVLKFIIMCQSHLMQIF